MASSHLEQVIAWLWERGGTVVRWRTATELCQNYPSPELEKLSRAVPASPQVQAWLARLDLVELGAMLSSLDEKQLGRLGGMVHGGPDRCLENVLGKLAEFGVRSSMQPIAERMLPLLRLFQWHNDWQQDKIYKNAWESLVKGVFAWGLLRCGFPVDSALKDHLLGRLEAMHKTARDQVYNIYADETELIGLPKAWRGKPVMKQSVMAEYYLPLIHDLYILASFPDDLIDEDTYAKIEDVVAYILDPRFQSLHNGYGYAWIKERRTCYGWGWSPHLPGYNGFDFERPIYAGELVQRLELMAHFPRARQSAWFKASLQHLEGFATAPGVYHFPSNYLREAEGYYVSGYHMGLEAGRRLAPLLEIESTFRMAKIQSLCQSTA